MVLNEAFLPKIKTRGERRHQKKLAKKRTKSRVRLYNDTLLNERLLGINTKTPKRSSSCRCCINPRKNGEKSLDEIKDLYNIKRQLEDLEEYII